MRKTAPKIADGLVAILNMRHTYMIVFDEQARLRSPG